MAADLVSIAKAFVTVLLENAAARDEFKAAMHPPDPARAVAVISAYAGVSETPISAADLPHLLAHIGKALDDARAAGATTIPASIMPGDSGGTSGSIMPGDSGGTSGSIMPGDSGGTSGSIMPGDSGGTAGSIMPGDSGSKPTDE